MTVAKQSALSQAGRIGFVGDLHGDLGALLAAAETMQSCQVNIVIVTGDFGFVWPGVNYKRTLDKISRRLARLGVTLYFVDGNHEWFPELYTYPVQGDGQRRLRENVVHLPRGFRVTLRSGRVLAALGGANSIDRDLRQSNVDWWAEESITQEDLSALGAAPVDVLVGHDAPLRVPSLDWGLAANELGLSDEMREYSLAGRRAFHKGFRAVQPALYLGGHYHRPVDEYISVDGRRSEFAAHVVLLDQAGPARSSLAVLDSNSLAISAVSRLHRRLYTERPAVIPRHVSLA